MSAPPSANCRSTQNSHVEFSLSTKAPVKLWPFSELSEACSPPSRTVIRMIRLFYQISLIQKMIADRSSRSRFAFFVFWLIMGRLHMWTSLRWRNEPPSELSWILINLMLIRTRSISEDSPINGDLVDCRVWSIWTAASRGLPCSTVSKQTELLTQNSPVDTSYGNHSMVIAGVTIAYWLKFGLKFLPRS